MGDISTLFVKCSDFKMFGNGLKVWRLSPLIFDSVPKDLTYFYTMRNISMYLVIYYIF